MAKTTYTVLSDLRHDGLDYAEGEPIELEPKQAKSLLESGVIEQPAKGAAPKNPVGK